MVILASLFFGLYLNRISYAFMVLGITVAVSQVHEQLGEFSNSLLLLRLEEPALGAAVAMAVVNLVLPLPTRRVLRIAFRDLVRAVGRLAGGGQSGRADKDICGLAMKDLLGWVRRQGLEHRTCRLSNMSCWVSWRAPWRADGAWLCRASRKPCAGGTRRCSG